ncbi:Predicted CoA-binding protein [Clostridium cavendishii DSM 21758]|uniref:Predicted CoA-binding protein n=1 Tax=Clostridium cavendishii DSM 21758 TaxID=1121302 RepID=A0A1M6VX11_9CLOT|nr:CoA-binding protein [Clostridium cavendishii]SHK85974.1 Predicted CoA-binding protein [Clostridium cavendishii DSM 21758]
MRELKAQELMRYKNWVVVGDVLNKDKYAYKILARFINSGYNVIGVNPRSDENSVAKNLTTVNFDIDVIDLCINPMFGIEIVKEAKKLGIDKILIQPGAESKEILDYCKNNGITAIEDCALIALSRL